MSTPSVEHARELHEHVVGDAERTEVGERPEHVDVLAVVGRAAVLVRDPEEPGLLEPARELVAGRPRR